VRFGIGHRSGTTISSAEDRHPPLMRSFQHDSYSIMSEYLRLARTFIHKAANAPGIAADIGFRSLPIRRQGIPNWPLFDSPVSATAGCAWQRRRHQSAVIGRLGDVPVRPVPWCRCYRPYGPLPIIKVQIRAI
jgi:hypothetical protein